jgi:hypothetical protein
MMHHVSIIWHLGTCKGQAWGEARALFCRKLVEAQEARDQQDEQEVKQWRWNA